MTKLIFLHAGKHENLKRIDTMILMEMVKQFKLQIASMQCLYNMSKKKLEISWFFACRESKRSTSSFQNFGHQSFLQGYTIIIDEHDEALSKYSK